MAKFMPNAHWYTRIDSERSYQIVSTGDPQHLRIAFMPGKKADGISVFIDRRDARLLARRIMQCLVIRALQEFLIAIEGEP